MAQDPYEKLDEELGKKSVERTIKENAEVKELQKTFRDVFSSYDGKKVLNVLLCDLKYFDTCLNERETALRNYATFLLEERMGFKNTVSITEKILESDFE